MEVCAQGVVEDDIQTVGLNLMEWGMHDRRGKCGIH